MKKTLLFLGVLLAVLTACGPTGKYADVKSAMDKMYAANEKYIIGLEKATSARDCANVINDFTNDVVVIIPEIKELEKKYSELDMKNNAYPPELADYEKKFDGQSERMQKVAMSLAKYMMDKDVMAALQNMARSLEGK